MIQQDSNCVHIAEFTLMRKKMEIAKPTVDEKLVQAFMQTLEMKIEKEKLEATRKDWEERNVARVDYATCLQWYPSWGSNLYAICIARRYSKKRVGMNLNNPVNTFPRKRLGWTYSSVPEYSQDDLTNVPKEWSWDKPREE